MSAPEARSGQLSVAEFFDRLKRDDLTPALTLTGMVKTSDGSDSAFEFSVADCESWVTVPLSAIETAQVVGKVGCGAGHSHPKVRLVFKEPGEANRWAYDLVAAVASAMVRVQANIGAALASADGAAAKSTSPSDDPTDRATCLRCMRACMLLPVPPEDPFAGVLCMLNCPGCPS